MSRRERILLIAAAVVITSVVFFYYVYSPKQAEYASLTGELADRQNQLDRMQATARQVAQLEKEFTELQSFIASVEAKLPTEKEMPALLVQLERLTKSLGISLRSIKPSSLEAVTAAGAPAPGGGGHAPAPPPPGAPTYFRFPINLSVTASYAELLRLTNALQSFPRLIVIRRLTMAPKDVPDLSSDLDTETFVLAKEAR